MLGTRERGPAEATLLRCRHIFCPVRPRCPATGQASSMSLGSTNKKHQKSSIITLQAGRQAASALDLGSRQLC